MGDPKKHRKKFSTPEHPWRKDRIDAEKEILKQYGLKRKYEIWKVDSILKKFLNRAKTLIAQRTVQSELEKRQLLERLDTLGLLKKDSKVEDVLNLTLKDVMERRLQTLVVRKQITKSMLQSRQLITHEHIAIGERKVTAPSYLVSVSEEAGIKLIDPITIAKPVEQQQKNETEEPAKQKAPGKMEGPKKAG